MNLKEAFAEGRRILGIPPLKEGDRLLLDKKTGQYSVETEYCVDIDFLPDPMGMSIPLLDRKIEKTKEVTMKIPNLILNLLTQCRVEDNKLYLPDRQLDRSVYESVNKVLVLLGGKWNRKEKAHIFDHDIAEHIEQCIVAGEVVDKKKQYQFFPTPAKIAELMVEKAELKEDDFILEPSAGTGGIADAIPVKYKVGKLLCIELNPECSDKLKEKGYHVLTLDYLGHKATGRISKIIMNPPFTRQQDITHVMKAWEDLAPGGRIVAVVSESCFFRQDKKAKEFREFLEEYNAEIIDLKEGEFKTSGTMVKTRIVCVNKPEGK